MNLVSVIIVDVESWAVDAMRLDFGRTNAMAKAIKKMPVWMIAWIFRIMLSIPFTRDVMLGNHAITSKQEAGYASACPTMERMAIGSHCFFPLGTRLCRGSLRHTLIDQSMISSRDSRLPFNNSERFDTEYLPVCWSYKSSVFQCFHEYFRQLNTSW